MHLNTNTKYGIYTTIAVTHFCKSFYCSLVVNLTFENDFVTRLKKSPTVFALDLVSDIFYWPRKLGGGGGRQAGRPILGIGLLIPTLLSS